MTAWYLLAAVVLLLANGFFVAAEFALIAARRSKLEQLANEGDRRARIAIASVKEISFMLAGTQLGITMASLGLGYVAEPAVGHLIESLGRSIEVPEAILHTASVVLGLTIVVFLHMVIGEMAPKNLAIADPERAALRIAAPFRFYANLFRPFINLLNSVAIAGLRLMGVQPKDELGGAHSAQEIGFMISESAKGGLLKPVEHRLLSGAVNFRKRDAASVMVPRTELVALPITATPAQIEQVTLDSGHSRLPVYEQDLDHIVGFFHTKDLLKVDARRRDKPLSLTLVRRMLVIPESRKLHPLLLDMRRERNHFALVLDEHGGTAGIVTLEDLLEELVGEILDEYDEDEAGIQRLGGNRYVVPGTLRIDEAKDRLNVALPEGEYETVAGFVMDELGRIPHRRDLVQHEGWQIRVLSMRRRRVLQVLIEPNAERPRRAQPAAK
jgi:CBS domain containing-hemolysin-like protein